MKRYISATRKEDDTYYQGPFWIVADCFKDIHRGNFEIIGDKLLSDYDGNYLGERTSKSAKTHKKVWDNYAAHYGNVDYIYYPRGRVAIYQGTAFIHINSKCNMPKVIDAVVEMYNLAKLEIEIDLNDTYQGSHYDFELK